MRMHSFSTNQTGVIFSCTLLLKLCKFSLNSTCILVVSYRVNSLYLPYDLLEGRRIDDVTICFFWHTKKNTVYVAVGLFSNRLQKTLKCSRNSGDARYRQHLVCHFYAKYSTGIKTISWWVEREGAMEVAGKGRKGGGGGRTPIQISPSHNFKSYCHNFANDSQFQWFNEWEGFCFTPFNPFKKFIILMKTVGATSKHSSTKVRT